MSGSVQASDRLMKELREIYRSQSYKTGMPPTRRAECKDVDPETVIRTPTNPHTLYSSIISP